jgi:hypothetical protein
LLCAPATADGALGGEDVTAFATLIVPAAGDGLGTAEELAARVEPATGGLAVRAGAAVFVAGPVTGAGARAMVDTRAGRALGFETGPGLLGFFAFEAAVLGSAVMTGGVEVASPLLA